jgi:hypothetical protein
VRIPADEQGACRSGLSPVFANSLGDRKNVGFIEGAAEGRTAMSAGAETHLLPEIGRVRYFAIIGLFKFLEIDQLFRLCRLTGTRVESHRFLGKR